MKNDKIRLIADVSNPFSSGGGGYDFERHIQAVFLLALAVEDFTPFFGRPVVELKFQAKKYGYNFDDIVATTNDNKCLHCQIKRSINITKSNNEFKEIMTEAWSDFKKYPKDILMLATGLLSKRDTDTVRFIHNQAINYQDETSFIRHIMQYNYTSENTRIKFQVIRNILDTVSGKSVTDREIWEFLRSFRITVFDMDYENSVNQVLINALIKAKSKADEKYVWERLFYQACDYDRSAATVTRDTLPDDIKELFGVHLYDLKSSEMILTISDYSEKTLWAQLALVGTWDENNVNDVDAIEKITGRGYCDVERVFRLELLRNSDHVSYINGVCSINNRKELFCSLSDYIFDETIATAFQIASGYVQEKSKQFSEADEYTIFKNPSGNYNNSEQLRHCLMEGLCLLSHICIPAYCNKTKLDECKHNLISAVFENCKWTRFASLYDLISLICEIEPDTYLRFLEAFIYDNPKEIINLFTKSDDGLMLPWFASSIIHSLTILSWDRRYLVNSMRCLSAMENVLSDNCNSKASLLDTMSRILFPYKPQTYAPLETIKNAVQMLRTDNEKICWDVLMNVLPASRAVIISYEVKPKFILKSQPDIPDICENAYDLIDFYVEILIDIAKNDASLITTLLNKCDDFSDEQMERCLSALERNVKILSKSQKSEMWIKLCDVKYNILRLSDSGEPQENVYYNKLCSVIEKLEPDTEYEQYKRLFLAVNSEYTLKYSKEMHMSYENAKCNAMRDLYDKYGLDSVALFGKEINRVEESGSHLGSKLNKNEMYAAIKACDKKDKQFILAVIKSFVYKNGVKLLLEIGLERCSKEFVADILSMFYVTSDLLGVINVLLADYDDLYWEKVGSDRLFIDEVDSDRIFVCDKLMLFERYSVVINMFRFEDDFSSISEEKLYELLFAFMKKGSVKDERPDKMATLNIISHLQQSDSPDIIKLSKIEWYFLPWIDNYSGVEPRAIKYRLSNEPEYFCELMRLSYKGTEKSEQKYEYSEELYNRLYRFAFRNDTIAGTDWYGEFNPERFLSWFKKVRDWADKTGRLRAVLHVIGNGVSYARTDERGLIDDCLLKILDSKENQELRNGFEMGLFNQQNAHVIDENSNYEMRFGHKYNEISEKVAALGYSRLAETYKSLANDFFDIAANNVKKMETRI